MKRFHVVAVVALIIIATGCTHKMEITNLDNYRATPTPPARTPRTVGITSANITDSRSERYVSCIVEALQKNGNLGRVIYPFNRSMHQDLVDSVVDIAVSSRYDGRGSNFWVNWPGFLIFAPAIWGYGYTADVKTEFSVSSPMGDPIARQSVSTLYQFRHADMGRTWTEVGWLEVGIIPLIGGFVFTNYDNDVTDEFISVVSPNYGAYVSQKIIATLPEKKTSSPAPAPSSGPAPAANETIVSTPSKSI